MPNRMDSMISHGMGKLKAVKARLSGLVGVFETLAEQHGEVSALLERAKTSDEKFADLWPQIRRELLSHEQAEIREVYSVMREHADLRAFAEHHDVEANELEQLIRTIDELGAGTPQRKDTYRRLVETVVHHAREEEQEIFPKAQQVLGKPEAEALDLKFLAVKRRLATSL